MTQTNTDRHEELTEEEFLELVLEEQRKALEEERLRRLEGYNKPKNKSPLPVPSYGS